MSEGSIEQSENRANGHRIAKITILEPQDLALSSFRTATGSHLSLTYAQSSFQPRLLHKQPHPSRISDTRHNHPRTCPISTLALHHRAYPFLFKSVFQSTINASFPRMLSRPPQHTPDLPCSFPFQPRLSSKPRQRHHLSATVCSRPTRRVWTGPWLELTHRSGAALRTSCGGSMRRH